MRAKYQSKQIVNVFKENKTVPKAINLYNNDSIFVSLIYTFSLAGNKTVYTPNRGTNIEKYFSHIIYKGGMPTLRPFLLS